MSCIKCDDVQSQILELYSDWVSKHEKIAVKVSKLLPINTRVWFIQWKVNQIIQQT